MSYVFSVKMRYLPLSIGSGNCVGVVGGSNTVLLIPEDLVTGAVGSDSEIKGA